MKVSDILVIWFDWNSLTISRFGDWHLELIKKLLVGYLVICTDPTSANAIKGV